MRARTGKATRSTSTIRTSTPYKVRNAFPSSPNPNPNPHNSPSSCSNSKGPTRCNNRLTYSPYPRKKWARETFWQATSFSRGLNTKARRCRSSTTC